MEPAMAVRMIAHNKQLKSANVAVGTFIADGDGATDNEVRRNSEVQVDKWDDFNHTKKSFSTALFNMKVSLLSVKLRLCESLKANSNNIS